MSFYQELSRYYDEIFAVSAEEMAFIKSLLRGRKRLLDLGCGTGRKTALLSAPDNHLTGTDIDQAMIARARAEYAGPGIDYEELDMLKAARHFPASSFDGVLCLGNTLVHLDYPGVIEQFAAGLNTLLKPGGLAVIQILNYDYLSARKVRELPLIETPQTVFRRYYDWGPKETLKFKTILEIKKTGQILKNEINLRPLGLAALEGLLRRAGFEKLENYGDYQGGPYRENSFTLITTAEKTAETRETS